MGLAEAGFFPGVIVYLTHWISYSDRAMATGRFMAAIPISFVIGSPLAAWLLRVHWLGLHGWRWIFIGQGIPAVPIGFIAVFYLPDRPADVRWLRPEERDWIGAMLEREKLLKKVTHRCTWWQALAQRDVVLLSVIAFFSYTGFYGLIFWLPTILKRLSGLPDFKVALLSALPYIAGFLAILSCGWHSDRSGERRWHAAGPLFLSGVSILFASGVGTLQWLTAAAFTGALLGFFGFLACFWAMPTAYLSESAAASSIGAVNLVGSVGGFFGPFIVGYLRSNFGSFAPALGVLALAMLVASEFREVRRLRDASELCLEPVA
jgi:ACS family tartrate transporter-like MFS transporter